MESCCKYNLGHCSLTFRCLRHQTRACLAVGCLFQWSRLNLLFRIDRMGFRSPLANKTFLLSPADCPPPSSTWQWFLSVTTSSVEICPTLEVPLETLPRELVARSSNSVGVSSSVRVSPLASRSCPARRQLGCSCSALCGSTILPSSSPSPPPGSPGTAAT